MKHFTLIFCLIVFTTIANADEWRPYVGVGGMMGTISATNYSVSHKLQWSPVNSCTGPHYELGLYKGSREWYAAISTVHTPDHVTHTGGTYFRLNDSTYISQHGRDSESWIERWLEVGYRYHPRAKNAMVNPVIGGGIGFGITRWRYNGYSSTVRNIVDSLGMLIEQEVISSYANQESFSSTLRYGGVLEVGASISLGHRIEALLLAQLYGHYMKTSDQQLNFFNSSRFNSIFFVQTFGFQLQYRL